ncbi:MAG: hypothetical protein WCB19_04485 [Thermoplasmata archaeon]
MAGWRRWKKGWDDIVPLMVLATPMILRTFLPGARTFAEVILVVAAVAVGLVLRHLLPTSFEDLALVPPALILLVELSTVPLTVDSLLLAAMAGVGLLLWAGAEPTSGVTLGQRLEPAVVPTLAVGVAVVVMLFLPGGSGGQVGFAALVLVAVLALSAWLYVRSAAEVTDAHPTS